MKPSTRSPPAELDQTAVDQVFPRRSAHGTPERRPHPEVPAAGLSGDESDLEVDRDDVAHVRPSPRWPTTGNAVDTSAPRAARSVVTDVPQLESCAPGIGARHSGDGSCRHPVIDATPLARARSPTSSERRPSSGDTTPGWGNLGGPPAQWCGGAAWRPMRATVPVDPSAGKNGEPSPPTSVPHQHHAGRCGCASTAPVDPFRPARLRPPSDCSRARGEAEDARSTLSSMWFSGHTSRSAPRPLGVAPGPTGPGMIRSSPACAAATTERPAYQSVIVTPSKPHSSCSTSRSRGDSYGVPLTPL